jgi:hypothetical protein
MPRYFYNLLGGRTVLDEAGVEFANLHSAEAHGLRAARQTIAEQVVRTGALSLTQKIEIVDEQGQVLTTISFSDAVQIER